MPTYEYKCNECNYVFELFQSMSAEPVKECPNCKGLVKRLIGTGSGPIFKGSGFYQTDYKNKNSSSSEKKSKEVKDTTKNSANDKSKPDNISKKEKEN